MTIGIGNSSKGRGWTQAQRTRMAEIIMAHYERGRRVPWKRYAKELGHTVKACSAEAHNIRERVRNEAMKDRSASSWAPAKSLRRKTQLFAPRETIKTCECLDHRIATSTAKFAGEAEIRNRISVQGLTAGLFGDPLPGRSALDQKRATPKEEINVY
jgi:hypothetical protein